MAKELAERGEDFVVLSYDPPAGRFKAKTARAWHAGRAFWRGVRDMVGPSLGISAWALVTGVAMVKGGLAMPMAAAMNGFVYAGSAQLAALPLIAAGAPLWVLFATAFCVNLRFVIFAAASLNFVALSRFAAPDPAAGQIFVLFIMGLAAAEVAVAVAGFDGRLMTLKVPNKFFSEQIKGHYQRRLEEHQGVPRLVLHASQAARVNYLGVNLLDTSVWLLGNQQASGDRDSTTLLATVALGGDYARQRSEARLAGEGGILRVAGLHVELTALVGGFPALDRLKNAEVAGDGRERGEESAGEDDGAGLLGGAPPAPGGDAGGLGAADGGKKKGGGGRQHLKSPWGQLAKSFPTRIKAKASNNQIILRRNGRKVKKV